ncbi:flagellar export protein FliJ [Patulibacter sp. SYSU D01012]|uniref:flagellar export protein FliJ n=1 Tax=Patulibacter sp. SYSU D01012 TaxID=2817381 RepID=UPI001B30EE13
MSSAFRFRLEPVRAVSERKEEDAQSALAAALRTERAARERLDAAAGDVGAALRDAADRRATTALTGQDLLGQEAWIMRTTARRAELLLDLDRQVTETGARRALLADVSRERQVLERLRDRQQAAHRAAQERIAQDQLDEIALGLHRRRAS